jgi:nucleoside-diphosphate-sugar epimerase
MITMINRGFFFFIGIPGASANYIHVDNVVEGLVRCGRARGNHFSIFNLSDHRTIEDFIAVIARELGRPAPMTRLPEKMVRWLAKIGACLPHFPLTESRINALTCRSVYSTERIERELGYAHPVSMEDGLRDLVQGWWRPV